MLEVSKGLEEPNDSDGPPEPDDDGNWVELPGPGIIAEHSRFPPKLLSPLFTLGPVENKGTFSDAWENVLLDVLLPVRAVGVNEENIASVAAVLPPEPIGDRVPPDKPKENVDDGVDNQDRQKNDPESGYQDSLQLHGQRRLESARLDHNRRPVRQHFRHARGDLVGVIPEADDRIAPRLRGVLQEQLKGVGAGLFAKPRIESDIPA